MNLENRRMALLLEEAQRLMAERDPAALIRHVCTAARPLTQASYVGVGVVDDDGAIDEFVAVGLDETVVAELRQSLTAHHDHPARATVVSREIVRGVNPGGNP
ncbi:MAG TPA: hypothetical protein VIZ32_25185, partial [Vicinamibacterales bacterium]